LDTGKSSEKEINSRLTRIIHRESLPEADPFQDLIRRTVMTMKSLPETTRPRDSFNRPGGIIHLRADLPTVLIPDLHGRAEVVESVMDYRWRDQTLLDMLKEKKLQVVFLGDAFHTEVHCQNNWLNAYVEYENGFYTHKHMDFEMIRNFRTLNTIMELKNAFPDTVFFLKGNHENITNENGKGNYPFGKYVHEGEMVRVWVQTFYGDDILDAIRLYEKMLPVLAIGSGFLASHAEPAEFYSEEDVIEYRENDNVIYGLTWTSNDRAELGSVRKMLEAYLAQGSEKALYFGGHRIIRGRYQLRNGNRFVQIHNPDHHCFMLLDPENDIDLDRDIIVLNEEETEDEEE
jgi:hypothetical protein